MSEQIIYKNLMKKLSSEYKQMHDLWNEPHMVELGNKKIAPYCGAGERSETEGVNPPTSLRRTILLKTRQASPIGEGHPT